MQGPVSGSELQALAEQIVQAQEAEIKQVQVWKAEWSK
jgi:uncharacterized protein (DUF305 family)